MGKRIQLNDDELYLIKAMLQDLADAELLSRLWAYKFMGQQFLKKLMGKLEAPTTKVKD